jgi:Uma2 family endonuclease
MSAGAPPTPLMTTEEMLALPENGMDRELICGELREKPMTRRNQWHSTVEARLAYLLGRWLDAHPLPGSRVTSGEAGFRLRKVPDTTVGIDVAFVPAEVVANTPKSAAFFEGAPVLAVEILSPSDTHQDITEKVEIYKAAGVALIWIVDPDLQTVLVVRPDKKPELFNLEQDLSGEPALPGFRVPVAEIFRF